MTEKTLTVPDIGDFEDVEVIELLVAEGDSIAIEDPLITLETDKATMDIPATDAGTIRQLLIKVGDSVSQGDAIMVIDADETPVVEPATEPAVEEKPAVEKEAPAPAARPTAAKRPPSPPPTLPKIDEISFSKAYASPAVRKFARELGVNLGQVSGSGRKGRILKDDVKAFVKQVMTTGLPASGGALENALVVEPMADIDFGQFGEIEPQPLSKINKLTGKFLHRNWVSVPHVTQFDSADITALEALRKPMDSEYREKGIRITLLAFLMKAVVAAMQEYPRFNSALDNSGENLVLKKYFHIGIAVDTPDGLVVPVVRDVDQLSVIDIGTRLGEISAKARDKKLRPADMQGGCMTISSLGGIGGTAFTPIVNAPEVAILGVSRSRMQPVWNGRDFEPRLMLPVSLSYDHRVIDGADGVRFTRLLGELLQEPKALLD